MKRPAVFPLPAPVLRILLGELTTVMLDGQRLVASASAFSFEYSTLDQALRNLLARSIRERAIDPPAWERRQARGILDDGAGRYALHRFDASASPLAWDFAE